MQTEYDLAGPGATELFESLRAFGYDLPTALADVIDNSLTAEARNIWIDMQWDGRASRIVIKDDGHGMTEERLVDAMRPGSQSPAEDRDPADLGRFGLGMKTASISQCRCLTVMTKAAGKGIGIRRWDLDYLSTVETGEWRLLKGPSLVDPSDLALLNDLESGTVLLWDQLDTLVGDVDEDDEVGQRHFRERAEAVRDHLSMVFHRFLRGRGLVKLHLNGRQIEPWDPFLEESSATEPLPSESLGSGLERFEVKAFILPHHSRISPEDHARAGGAKGWNAHQGFYIYRNKRLLVAGDWLGLGMQKEEHFKLARIRIDLPNSTDMSWQIDVKKSQANPPAALRKDLKRIAKAARSRASSIYRHRGKLIQRRLGDENVFLWKHLIKHGKTFYKINRDHPLVSKVMSNAPDKKPLRALIDLIEQTVPAPLIVINNAEAPDSMAQPFEGATSELRKAMEAVFEALVETGKSRDEAALALAQMDPFSAYPEILAAFVDQAGHSLSTTTLGDEK
jgi:Histidine kinase-, DNA gyrase B-, and HSP90-like ATPase